MIMGYKMIHPNRKRPGSLKSSKIFDSPEETLTVVPPKKQRKKKKAISSAQSYDKLKNKKKSH